MKLTRLNGWLRIFVILTSMWVVAMCILFYRTLPDRADKSALEFYIGIQVRDELDKFSKSKLDDFKYSRATSICDEAQEKRNVNTNECLSALLGSEAVTRVKDFALLGQLSSPIIDRRVIQEQEKQSEEYWSTFREYAPKYLAAVFLMPLLLLLAGYLVAWVRKGFQEST